MQKDLIKTVFEKINTKAFYFLIFIYQVVFIFQGLELTDIGFHSTFYQQIFNDPESVQYGFPFWFSGILGGTWYHFFSSLGLLGIRLAGVLTTTLIVILSFNLLKKYLNEAYLKLGLFLVVIFLGNEHQEFYYNNISPFLFVVASIFLFTGLKENNLIKIFLCGVFLTLNVFSRFPSILGLSLALAIFYSGYLNRVTLKNQLRQFLSLLGGISVTAIAVLLIMKAIGHLDLYIDSIMLLGRMTKTNEKSAYDSILLVKIYTITYFQSLVYGIVAGFTVIFVNYVITLLRKKITAPKWLPGLLAFVIISLIIIPVVIKGRMFTLLYLYTGICMLVTFAILIGKKSNDIKVLTVIAALLAFIFPLGSSQGVLTAGFFSLWLLFPIVVDYLFSFEKIQVTLSALTVKTGSSISLGMGPKELNLAKLLFVLTLSYTLIIRNSKYPPLDASSGRTDMHYSVNNKFVKGIYTSKERAQVIDEVLTEISKYVKPNDYLLCYSYIPMINFMTNTRPYMGNPYTGMFPGKVFEEQLSKSIEKKKILPAIVIQKINPYLFQWPEKSIFEKDESIKNYGGEFSTFFDTVRDNYLNWFIKTNNYTEVFSNNIFSVFIPPGNPVISKSL